MVAGAFHRRRWGRHPARDQPDDVELEVVSKCLGEDETEASYRHRWTEGDRSIPAEEVKNEIYDGAMRYSTYVRRVIVDGDRAALFTARDDNALIVEDWAR
jgi:hypothetical protein